MTQQLRATSRSDAFAQAKRIVAKVGTRVLTQTDGRLALSRLFQIVEATAALQRQGREVLLVTSGAVGLGRDALGLTEAPRDLPLRQTCAAIGQSRLMSLYQEGFSRLGLTCAQVLLTAHDFEDRASYLSLRAALQEMLARDVLPIINENDVVATEELALTDNVAKPVFGDNDKLSALVASKLDADLLVLMTDVPGLFARDPRTDPNAPLLERVDNPDELQIEIAGSSSGAGRGGMRTKVEAATIAARSGCHAVITSGANPHELERVIAGDPIGTWFPARGPLSARRRWIAFASRPQGRLLLDAGAVKALLERGASLLAAGVTGVEGSFAAGEVVELVGPDGKSVGRGVIEVDAAAARAWTQGQAPASARHHDALVHRDQLVLEGGTR